MSRRADRPPARERILSAAVGRIASEGIDGVRIARIATDAGVSSALVHYHFDTREELLTQALDYSFDHADSARIEVEEPADATRAQRLAAMVDQCLPITPELREDWILWMELWLRAVRHPELQPFAESLYGRMHEWFADEIAAGVQNGEFEPCDPHEVTDRTLALLDGLGVRHLIGDSSMTLERARRAAHAGLARDLGLGDQLVGDGGQCLDRNVRFS